MRMLVHAKIPNSEFNAAVRDGSVGETINRILDKTNPEAVYFSEHDGKRGAIMLVDIDNPSKIPAIAEPWFLLFNAEVEFHVVMTPDDLAKSGLDEIGKRWTR